MKPLVIYHDKCTDGFGAAFAAWLNLNKFSSASGMAYATNFKATNLQTPLYALPVAPADKDAERWRELLIACRGSVQFDLNNYERVINEMDRADQQRTAAYAAVSDERTRLARLLNTIDAAMAKGE